MVMVDESLLGRDFILLSIDYTGRLILIYTFVFFSLTHSTLKVTQSINYLKHESTWLSFRNDTDLAYRHFSWILAGKYIVVSALGI